MLGKALPWLSTEPGLILEKLLNDDVLNQVGPIQSAMWPVPPTTHPVPPKTISNCSEQLAVGLSALHRDASALALPFMDGEVTCLRRPKKSVEELMDPDYRAMRPPRKQYPRDQVYRSCPEVNQT